MNSRTTHSRQAALAERITRQRTELGKHWRALDQQAEQADHVITTVGKVLSFVPGLLQRMYRGIFNSR